MEKSIHSHFLEIKIDFHSRTTVSPHINRETDPDLILQISFVLFAKQSGLTQDLDPGSHSKSVLILKWSCVGAV